MSHSKNKITLDAQTTDINVDKGATNCNRTESCTYAVTVSNKSSGSGEEASSLCVGQKSFISIHSTDHLCQVTDIENPANLDECNVEVLSLNEVFPSTSEESFSNDDESPVRRKRHSKKSQKEPEPPKSIYVPTNSKSSTTPGRQRDGMEAQTSVLSDLDLPKNTMCVIGSNPGEPKKSYQDAPKKMSKTMKKFLRNIDKHKNDQSKSSEKAISKLTTMRGILKDGGCGPECTGDSSAHDTEDFNTEDLTSLPPYAMDFGPNYAKPNPDKNVSFNSQVLIIHFTGDLCVGQSIETLSKEKDQQARNSELRKTFLTKYNELWPTEK
ncbi:uncharacterized protein LOC123868306 isoform X2 [Maniola jurtina]|uniref:uncharacterized protein LOC123868306 isoform X2 n=1 Tax=Maniola jurtina TaxID=191418 RepID=UPI001E689874|nr:uncharacterized protein LOC123868306 isoform X2 [Maniola jurtina]